jgi:SAM domain (Sterile alpha motif)
MANKNPKDYSIDEVCIWLNAIGFGEKAPAFRESTVDGSFLLTLGVDDLKELGLTPIQGKRLLHNLQMSTDFAEAGGMDRINQLEAENAELRAKLKGATPPIVSPPPPVQAPPAPAPSPSPSAPRSSSPPPPQQHHSPPPSHHHSPKREPGVVEEAGRGALRGAVVGAVGGA